MRTLRAAIIVAHLVPVKTVHTGTSEQITDELPENVKDLIERSADQRLGRIDALRERLGELRKELRAVSRDQNLSREQRAEAREEIKERMRKTLDDLAALRLNRPPFLAALRMDALEPGQIGRMPHELIGAAVEKRLGEGRAGVTVTLHDEAVQVMGARDGVIRILELYDGGELGYARGKTLWIRGVPTKGWRNGQGIDLADASAAFEVIGTRTYKTPTGAARSVMLVERFDVTPWLRYFPQGEKP